MRSSPSRQTSSSWAPGCASRHPFSTERSRSTGVRRGHQSDAATLLASSTPIIDSDQLIGNFPPKASFSQTKELGAHALVRAAVDPAVAGGQFVGPKGYKGPTQIGEAPKYTTDQAAADRLWKHLEKATGVIWP